MSKNNVLVNSKWANYKAGKLVKFGGETYTIGVDAFASVAAAVAAGQTIGIATLNSQNATFPTVVGGNSLQDISAYDYLASYKNVLSSTTNQEKGTFKAASRNSVSVNTTDGGLGAYGYQNASIRNTAGIDLEAGNISTNYTVKDMVNSNSSIYDARVSTNRTASGVLTADDATITSIATITDANANVVADADQLFVDVAKKFGRELNPYNDVAYAVVDIKDTTVNGDLQGGRIITSASDRETSKTTASTVATSDNYAVGASILSAGSALITASTADKADTVGDIDFYDTVKVVSTADEAKIATGDITGGKYESAAQHAESEVTARSFYAQDNFASKYYAYGTVEVDGKNLANNVKNADDVVVCAITGFTDVDVSDATVTGDVSGYNKITASRSVEKDAANLAGLYAIKRSAQTEDTAKAVATLTADNVNFISGGLDDNYLLSVDLKDGVVVADGRDFNAQYTWQKTTTSEAGYAAAPEVDVDSTLSFANKTTHADKTYTEGEFTASYSAKLVDGVYQGEDSTYDIGDIDGYVDITIDHVGAKDGAFTAASINSYKERTSAEQAEQQVVAATTRYAIAGREDYEQIATGTLVAIGDKNSAIDVAVTGSADGIETASFVDASFSLAGDANASYFKQSIDGAQGYTLDYYTQSSVEYVALSYRESVGDFNMTFKAWDIANNAQMIGAIAGYETVLVQNANFGDSYSGDFVGYNNSSANPTLALETATAPVEVAGAFSTGTTFAGDVSGKTVTSNGYMNADWTYVSSATSKGVFNQEVTIESFDFADGAPALFTVGSVGYYETVSLEGVTQAITDTITGGDTYDCGQRIRKGLSGAVADYDVEEEERYQHTEGALLVTGVEYVDSNATPQANVYLNSQINNVNGFETVKLVNTSANRISASEFDEELVTDRVAGLMTLTGTRGASGTLTATADQTYFAGGAATPVIDVINQVLDVNLSNVGLTTRATSGITTDEDFSVEMATGFGFDGTQTLQAAGSFVAARTSDYTGAVTVFGAISGYKTVSLSNVTDGGKGLAINNGGVLTETYLAGVLLENSGYYVGGSVSVNADITGTLRVSGYSNVNVINAADANTYYFGSVGTYSDSSSSTFTMGCQDVDITSAAAGLSRVAKFLGTAASDTLTFDTVSGNDGLVILDFDEDASGSADWSFGEGSDTIFFGDGISAVNLANVDCLNFDVAGLGIGLDSFNSAAAVNVSGLSEDQQAKFKAAVAVGSQINFI